MVVVFILDINEDQLIDFLLESGFLVESDLYEHEVLAHETTDIF